MPAGAENVSVKTSAEPLVLEYCLGPKKVAPDAIDAQTRNHKDKYTANQHVFFMIHPLSVVYKIILLVFPNSRWMRVKNSPEQHLCQNDALEKITALEMDYFTSENAGKTLILGEFQMIKIQHFIWKLTLGVKLYGE